MAVRGGTGAFEILQDHLFSMELLVWKICILQEKNVETKYEEENNSYQGLKSDRN